MPAKTNGFKPTTNGHKLIEMECNTLLEEKPFVPEQEAITESTEPAPVPEEQPKQPTEEAEEEELSAEELLLQTKAETKAQTATDPTTEPEETSNQTNNNSGIERASEAIGNEAGKKAELLARIDQKTANANLMAGIKEGKKAVQHFQAGYHMAVLEGVGQVKLTTALELSKQLDLLSEFTDEKSAEQTQETIEKLLNADDTELDKLTQELEELLGKKQEGNGLNLLAGI